MADAPLATAKPTQQFGATPQHPISRRSRPGNRLPGLQAIMPSSARHCRSSASSSARLSTSGPGRKVLDVAAGNGMASLAAARRWCDVTSTDYVPALLERGRARAAAEGLAIEFKEADAEALPFADGAFDTVLSTFGVMFTPNQDQAAAELLRVCKSGGQIGLANWTPDGFIGQMFKTLGKYCRLRPAPNLPRSGERAHVSTEMFGSAATSIKAETAQLQLSLSVGGALPGGVQDLLRSDAQGIRRARSSKAERSGERPGRPHCAHEQSRPTAPWSCRASIWKS